MGYPKLDDLEVYKLANQIAEIVYNNVQNWGRFHLYSIGNQLIRSIDSVAANIAEGYGRYFYKDNIRFCYYARGSLYESKLWIQKSYERELFSENIYTEILTNLELLSRQLNAYINYLYASIKR